MSRSQFRSKIVRQTLQWRVHRLKRVRATSDAERRRRVIFELEQSDLTDRLHTLKMAKATERRFLRADYMPM